MLRSMLHPLLALLFVASSYFAYSSAQAVQPLNIAPSAPVAVGGVPVGAQNQPNQPLPPPVAPAPLPDVDAMIVLDHSGSMSGVYCGSGALIGEPATDAEELRVKATQVVVAGLAADLDPRQTSLGLVTFGNNAQLLRPLTPLSNDDSRVRDELSAAVENPPCLGETNIVEAFRIAARELQSERASPGNTPAIIFLTDGENTVGSNSDVARAISDLPDMQIFVVLLGDKIEQAFWQDQGQRHGNMSVYTLADNSQLPDLYRDITNKLNDIPTFDTPSLPPGQMVTLAVPPNVKQIVITAIKRLPTIPLSITAPSGADARGFPADRFRALTTTSPVEVFVIDRPDPGDWLFQVPDGEVVTILRPELKSAYQVQLLQPDSSGLLGVDQVSDLVVQVVDVDSQTPLAGTFTLQGSYSQLDANDVTPLAFQPGTAPLQYSAQVPAGAFVEGQSYRFTFEVSDDRGLSSQSAIYQLEAGRLPILLSVSVSPRSYINEEVQIATRVANTDVISGQATLRVVQNVPDATAPVFRAIDADNFIGTMTFARPGNYTLPVAYSGTTTSGRQFSSVRTFSLSVLEPAWLPVARGLATVLAILLALYFIVRFLLLKWLIPLLQRMKLAPQGYVRITPPGQKHPYPEANVTSLLVSKRKFFRLSVGVGSNFDICLEEDANKLNDENYRPPQPTRRERLLGKKPLGSVRVRNGSTVIEVGASSRTFPQQGVNSLEGAAVNDNTVEVSLNPIDDQF